MTTAVKEHGMIFSAPMICALRDDRKSMTRRIIKQLADKLHWSIPPAKLHEGWLNRFGCERDDESIRCPYQIGDRIYAKEMWVSYRERTRKERRQTDEVIERFNAGRFKNIVDAAKALPKPTGEWKYLYRAGFDEETARSLGPWKSSRFMPKAAARIWREITDVRAERIQAISEEDAIAEGIRPLPLQDANDPSAWWEAAPGQHQARSAVSSFRSLWDSLHGAGAFEQGSWVWVISFKRVE